LLYCRYEIDVVVIEFGLLCITQRLLFYIKGTLMMIDICKIHKVITLFQVSLVLLSCLVSALGGVITHPLVHYAGYAALGGLVSILLTSLVMSLILLMSSFHITETSRQDKKKTERGITGLSWKMYLLILRRAATEAGIEQARRCRNKTCLLHCQSVG
jgi:hypothetical protein